MDMCPIVLILEKINFYLENPLRNLVNGIH